MDHDRLFKELLTNFFLEFLALFAPDALALLEPGSAPEFLDKEVFTGVTAGGRHEVDLVARVRLQGQDAFFLVHVESQSSAQSEFPKRMFRYFARLHEKYDLPIYPIALFSYDAPQRAEPTEYQVGFPGKPVLRFDYTVIQLNRLPWRRFVTQANPVASALMAKMKMAAKDRPKVKLECLRLLSTLKLDPARSKLIGGFIDSYLQLTAQETTQYEREFESLAPVERETTMTLVSSWEQRGIERGIQQGIERGKEELLAVLIQQRFGAISAETTARMNRLSSEQLNDLGIALFNFGSADDLEQWFARHS